MTTRSAAGLDPQLDGQRACHVTQGAERLLHGSQYLALRAVSCTYLDGRLVLHGQVPSFYLVQLAQALVCRLPGVHQVENRLQVTAPIHPQHAPLLDPQHEHGARAKPRFAGRGWDEALSLAGPLPTA